VIRLVVIGAAGRMGRAIGEVAAGAPDVEIKARVDVAANPGGGSGVWTSDPGAVLAAGDVAIEFATPAAAAQAARVCAERGAALVSGTTGLGAAEDAAVRAAAARVAVVRAANFSLGVAALRRLVRAALETLPATWDIEVVERHHRAKQDAPSGTALALARDAAGARGWPDSALRFGREGRTGPRPDREVGVHAVRGGSWVGDHEVLLAGAGEWIELRHVAGDRAAFASGALAAARFAATAAPGLYDLEDVLAGPR
jgi:4-hydroxy-tetrahydrodipicolinate reductase